VLGYTSLRAPSWKSTFLSHKSQINNEKDFKCTFPLIQVESTVIDFPSHLSKNAISFIESLLKKNPEERMTGQDILRHPFLAQVKEKQM